MSENVEFENEAEKDNSLEELDGQIEELTVDKQEAADLQVQIDELQVLLEQEKLRSAATVQNLQRRHQEEIQAAHKFAGAKFAQEMLSIKDYLEMALLDQSGNFDALKMGVDLTLKQLISAFDKAHITEINPEGGLLDPNLHSAMSAEESDEAPNTILKVMQKGYALNDRVLRPAMVIVAKAKEDLAK